MKSMKLRFFQALLLVALTLPGFSQVNHQKVQVRGIPIHLVTVDLNDPEVTVKPILAPHGETASLHSLVSRSRPTVAVTGTFFDTVSRVTVGNVVEDGRLLTEGSVGSVFSIDLEGKAELRSLNGTMGRHMSWEGVQFAISGGPTLLDDGQMVVAPHGEGFRDPGLFGSRQRAALGVTAANKLMIVTTGHPVSLHRLARMMADLGCREAINLDGGSSTALYYQGQVLTRPRRSLTNLVAIYTKTPPSNSEALGTQYAQAYKHFLRGQRLFASGQLIHARSQIRKALVMAPDRAPYWEGLAQVEAAREQTGEATEAYLKAADLYLGWSQTEGARRCVTAASLLTPEDGHIQSLLAELERT